MFLILAEFLSEVSQIYHAVARPGVFKGDDHAAQGQRLHQDLLDWLKIDWAEWKESISEMPTDVDDMEQPDPMEENVFSFFNRCVLCVRANS